MADYFLSRKYRDSINAPPSLSSSSDPLAEELQCPVCLDEFTDPVSTPCGHSFCESCLNQSWDNSQEYTCPTCRNKFSKRPDLKNNTALSQRVQEFKKKFSLNKSDVLCDICDERKMKALKSCLVCQTSYCQAHLEPHLRVPNLRKHQLMDPVRNIEGYICQKHERPLELFCRDDRKFICVFCSDGDHKTHNTVSLEEESKEKKIQLLKTQKKVQEMIQDRFKKIQEVKQSAELKKRSREREKACSVELFTALIDSIERCQAELLQMMEEKQKAAENQEEELIQELEREITELKMRNTDLDHLSHTEDQLHFLQIYPIMCSPPCDRNWSEISIDPVVSYETLRRALTELQENLDRNFQILRMQQYAVNVILDPDTAHPRLILSDDGKQVRSGDINKNLSNNPERFDSYTSVLGKEGFSSGRFYFEVQVKGKTHWSLGVARESVNKKGWFGRKPSEGSWIVHWDNTKCFTDPPVPLSLRVTPQKVGVFVDYEKGLVSFYDVESRSHIHSFTGQIFTEKLFPLLDSWDCDKTSVPLVISPC